MSLLPEGKRAFVTGGTRGLGAAICEVFAREDADVAFNHHSRDGLAEETKARIESHGRRAHAFKISVNDRPALKKTTRELAAMAAFLVSDRNSFVNGEVVIVDGGAVT